MFFSLSCSEERRKESLVKGMFNFKGTGMLFCFCSYLDDIGPDVLVLSGGNRWTEPMGCFLRGHLRGNVESFHVPIHQLDNGFNVGGLHLTQTLGRGMVRDCILANLVLRLASMGQVDKVALVQLLPVERAVVVAACADGPGEDNTGRIQTLPDLVQVADASDFLDEDGGQALAAKLLVDTEEVDFRAGDGLVANSHAHGDGRDEGDELAGLSGANADVVVLGPARRHHGPGCHADDVSILSSQLNNDVAESARFRPAHHFRMPGP